jgi:uncharacterized protein
MQLIVHVKPHAKQARVEHRGGGVYDVWIDAPARHGNANHRLITLMATELNVAPSQISVRRGLRSRRKVLVVETASEVRRSAR